MEFIAIFVLFTLGVLGLAEIMFRIWHRHAHGRDYFVALKFRWDENHVVAHPFLNICIPQARVYRAQSAAALCIAP